MRRKDMYRSSFVKSNVMLGVLRHSQKMRMLHSQKSIKHGSLLKIPDSLAIAHGGLHNLLNSHSSAQLVGLVRNWERQMLYSQTLYSRSQKKSWRKRWESLVSLSM